MDSDSSIQLPSSKQLKIFASNVEDSGNNTLLHQFVLENSEPNNSGSENYINAVLLSISDIAIDALNDAGYTALHLAVLKHNILMVKKMLSCLVNIDVNKQSRTNGRANNTALHLAAKLGYESITKELLNKGADMDIKNRKDYTALCLAALLGHLDIIKLLVSEGANVNLIGRKGGPLHCAVKSGSLEAVKFLLSNGADMSAIDECQRTPLYYAARSGDLAIVELLISHGADVNERNMNNKTPLSYALEIENWDMVKLFVENGVDLKGTDEEGCTLLHRVCCSEEHSDIIEIFLRKGCDVNAKNNFDETPLFIAVFMNNLDYTQLLLERGASVHVVDVNGWTPLHVAVNEDYAEITEVLLTHGADINAKDNDGKTPLDVAKENNYQFCIDALLNSNANF